MTALDKKKYLNKVVIKGRLSGESISINDELCSNRVGAWHFFNVHFFILISLTIEFLTLITTKNII